MRCQVHKNLQKTWKLDSEKCRKEKKKMEKKKNLFHLKNIFLSSFHRKLHLSFLWKCTYVPSKGWSIGRDGLKTANSRLSPPLFFEPLALLDPTELEPTLLLVSVLTVPESSCKMTDSLCCWFAVKFIFSLFSLAFSIIVRTDAFISVSTATKCSPELCW